MLNCVKGGTCVVVACGYTAGKYIFFKRHGQSRCLRCQTWKFYGEVLFLLFMDRLYFVPNWLSLSSVSTVTVVLQVLAMEAFPQMFVGCMGE